MAWDADDREAHRTHGAYEGERCPGCHTHPSLWKHELGGHRNAVVPTWTFCRVCELIEQAKKAGPPTKTPGWHLILTHNPSP